MSVDSTDHAVSEVSETIRLGPLEATVVTPAGASGAWLRSHYRSHLSERDAPEAELRLLPPRGSYGRRVEAAGGEIRVAIRQSAGVRVASTWHLTPRAVARAVKWGPRPGWWRRSRRQLLVRHGFEHPLMSLLDLRHGWFSIHAAAVARGGEGLLILGPNGAGKTTAALQLVAGGWQLLSDNFVGTDGARACGFPGATRQKDPSGAIDERRAAEPIAAEVRVAGLMLCGRGSGVRRLDAEEAHAALRAYGQREREDHRDSHVFPLIGDILGVSGRSCESDVMARLAHCPVVEWNWRDVRVETAVEGLTP